MTDIAEEFNLPCKKSKLLCTIMVELVATVVFGMLLTHGFYADIQENEVSSVQTLKITQHVIVPTSAFNQTNS